MKEKGKIGIIGCGNVGATIAYTLLMRGSCTELVLIDQNREKAEGEAMDLCHCLPFLSPMDIYAGDYSDLSGAGIIVVAAGVGQMPGETRIDLLHRNAEIFRHIMEQIKAVTKDAILLIVTNPVDILTHVSQKLSGFDPRHVIGSGTVLDTARLKYLVGKRLDVDPRQVHSFIIGEHGDSELAVWSGANVSGINIEDYCPLTAHCERLEDLYPLYEDVKNSAYRIIEGKGATYYAIAQASARIIDAIIGDENAILPVSAVLSGQYGVEGLAMSVPAIVGKNGIQHILDIPLSDWERENLMRSASTLRDILVRVEAPELV